LSIALRGAFPDRSRLRDGLNAGFASADRRTWPISPRQPAFRAK